MFDKTIGKIIPVRIRIPWWRDKSVRTQHDYSAAVSPLPDPQLSTFVSSPGTSQALSFRNTSDVMQITLPMVQAAAAAIPVVGSPLAAAIGGLVAIVNVINTSIQNREALDTLTRQLYNLCCHLANAPTPRTPIEEISRRALTKELENTTKELLKMQGRRSGSARLTQDIAGCSSKISNFLLQFMVSSQWQLSEMMHTMQTKIDYMSQFAVGQDGRLPAVMTVSCAVVIDATGEEHRMPLDQCCSFERLIAFLPGILSKCRPDKAHIQQWYIDRGQYGFAIDNGTNMTQLTRESDVWSTIEPGTKIVMRVITTEVSRRLSASYQCHCGKWNEVKVDQAAVMDALKDGFTVTCFYCERRLQIIVTKGKKALRQQVEQSQTKDDEPVIEEKILIRNMLRKQELEEEDEIILPKIRQLEEEIREMRRLIRQRELRELQKRRERLREGWHEPSEPSLPTITVKLLTEFESIKSEGVIANSSYEPELPRPESAHHALTQGEVGITGQQQQHRSRDAGCVAHPHQHKQQEQDGEHEDPRCLQYGQQGHSDHPYGSGHDSRRVYECTDPQRSLIAEPQVKGSRHPGGEGSYHYREQSGSGSGHGKESGSGECEPAPIPAGVTYPVPPVHPLMSSRRYGNVGVEQERQREREGNEHREGKGGDARDEY